MLARALRSRPRPLSTIAVNTVCRVVSGNAGDEATALKMDALIDKNLGTFKGYCSGITSIDRKVCKSEWTYVVQVNFDNIDSLHGYLESPEYDTVIRPVLQEFGEWLWEGPKRPTSTLPTINHPKSSI